MNNLENQTIQQLERYISERGQRESSIFQLAEDNLVSLRDRVLQEINQPPEPDISSQFDQQFFRWQDGTIRNFPDKQDIAEFDTTQKATSFVNKDTDLTSRLKRQLLIAQRLITNHGMAWSNRFINTYLNTPENITTVYWKDMPLGLQAKPDFAASKDEYLYLADPQHNPNRKPVWTGVYSDTVTKIWMMSAIVPLYQGDKFIGSFGHDIKLNSLIEQTINNNLPGAYNIIFDRNGRLIAHPQYVEQLQQAQGQLNINDLNDENLQEIFRLSLTDAQTVVKNERNDEFLAFTELVGPDWVFVTVYPKTLLSELAFDTIQFVLMAGLAALLVEVILLFSVLKNQIISPLSYITTASQSLSNGNFDLSLQVDRKDELGQLALSFSKMAHQLQGAFQDLQNKVTEKEQTQALVVEKNNTLERVLKELQTAQLQTVQNEKMATLGNLVAGIAHEINNPLGFLKGSIRNAQTYSQDLFEYLDIYQEQQPPNETVQTSAEDVDIDFVREDFPKLLSSMQDAATRIKAISTSLRTFSRADIEHKVSSNLHAGLDSTLLILKYRLKANEHRPTINVVQAYGNLPEIDCFPGQLNQVFMNILANAIDMFDEMAQQTTFSDLKENPQQITITTAMSASQTAAEIRISDNGKGMSDAVKSRIFENLFTTKAVGKGTGLGMAIAYQIITETHGGTITVESELNQGSTFILSLPVSLSMSAVQQTLTQQEPIKQKIH